MGYRSSWVVVVPIKRLSSAKSRLAPALDPDRRAEAALSLAAHVVRTAKVVVKHVLVVSSDDYVRREMQRLGAATVPDAPRNEATLAPEMRSCSDTDSSTAAYLRGCEVARELGFSEALLLASDLPLLEPGDVAAALRRPGHDGVCLAPSASGWGTNALASRLPLDLPLRYGPRSFYEHLDAAVSRGLAVRVLRRRGLAFDLDTPTDLEEVASLGRPGEQLPGQFPLFPFAS